MPPALTYPAAFKDSCVKQEVIHRLNDINRSFYNTVAESFDETRGQPWPGWNILHPYFVHKARDGLFSVLDIGCGNGRFGVFLAKNLPYGTITYHGLDNSPTLLRYAEDALRAYTNITVMLEQHDVVATPPTLGEYDAVVLFGIIHHIPGTENRREFIRQVAQRVKPRGLMVFACWRFYEYERFTQRIVPWPDDLTGEVESHDYLLDWRRGETALRYCHYVDNTEHTNLVAASGLTEIHTFRADGFANAVNKYSVLQRS